MGQVSPGRTPDVSIAHLSLSSPNVQHRLRFLKKPHSLVSRLRTALRHRVRRRAADAQQRLERRASLPLPGSHGRTAATPCGCAAQCLDAGAAAASHRCRVKLYRPACFDLMTRARHHLGSKALACTSKGIALGMRMRSACHHSICMGGTEYVCTQRSLSRTFSFSDESCEREQRSSRGTRRGTGSNSTSATRRASSRTATGCWRSSPSCGPAPRPSSRRVDKPRNPCVRLTCAAICAAAPGCPCTHSCVSCCWCA